MAAKPLPSIELLRQLFVYNDLDGGLYRTKKKALKKVGSLSEDKYVYVYVKGKMFGAHRIIWAMHSGIDPGDDVIDHVNGNTFDNRINNLEKVTKSENQKRRKIQQNGRAQRELEVISRSKFFNKNLKS